MKNKVIFIINSIQQQRCLKRIEEFIANGYQVEVYGFSRSTEIPTPPHGFSINTIGSFSNDMSYLSRIFYMYKKLKPIFKKHENDNVIYYYFMLDIAIVSRMLNNKPYIYEESDLMQTYSPRMICQILNIIDKSIIRHSMLTVMTSEGFIKYHYGNHPPKNICTIPNRINARILELNYTPNSIDIEKQLRIAFVGGARFKSIVNFANIFLHNFPQYELHFYGTISDQVEDFNKIKEIYPNVFFHGKFNNPLDLPQIYANIDMVLATYDTEYDNVRYAEPNKLYEAIYFQKPIIVSKGTFLSEKVERLGVGYSINPMNNDEIISLFKTLTNSSINDCILKEKSIDKNELININYSFFERLQELI